LYDNDVQLNVNYFVQTLYLFFTPKSSIHSDVAVFALETAIYMPMGH